LTPINPSYADGWQKLRHGIFIREHCTALSEGDVLYTTLPPEVKKLLVEKLGRPYTEQLLSWNEKQLPIRSKQ
jgi:hypothetical protein